jgi:hypothetical protein
VPSPQPRRVRERCGIDGALPESTTGFQVPWPHW